MKIAFSAQLLMNKNKTGIPWVAYNIVKDLKAMYAEHQYILEFFLLGKKKLEITQETMRNYRDWGYCIDACKWFHYGLYKMIWPFIPVPQHLFFKEKPDVTLFFNFYIPPGVKGKKVTIIHDMVYRAHPETVNKKTLYMLRASMKATCKRADKIIVVSEFTKQELMKYMHVAEDKIKVIHLGVDRKKFQVCQDTELIEQVKCKFGIDQEYFLYLGALEPRKNIVRMLEAYMLLKKEYPDAPKFVLAGGKGWMYESIFQMVEDYRLQNDVIFTGYVAEEDVPVLMSGAKAFLFVSIYEGFGMPLLEAMACGTPVITANAASMPEVVGDCGLLADPLSSESIKDCMAKIINNEIDVEDMTARALKRCEEFTWEKAAEKVMEVFESVV